MINFVLALLLSVSNGYNVARLKNAWMRLISLVWVFVGLALMVVYGVVITEAMVPIIISTIVLRSILAIILIFLIPYSWSVAETNRLLNNEIIDLKREIKATQLRLDEELVNTFVHLLEGGIQVDRQQSAFPAAQKVRAETLTRKTLLAIWPSSVGDLDLNREDAQIWTKATTYHYEVLDVNVTRERVILYLNDLRPYLVHVGSHATVEGVQLDDGIASPGWWGRVMQLYPPEIVFVNACSSEEVVQAIYEAGVPNVVGYRTEVLDNVAIAVARNFYHWINRGLDIRDAIERTRLALEFQDDRFFVRTREKTGDGP